VLREGILCEQEEQQEGGGGYGSRGAARACSPTTIITRSDLLGCSGVESTSRSFGLLSCCGHVGPLQAVRAAAGEQRCLVESCKAPVRPSCVIDIRDLTGGSSSSSSIRDDRRPSDDDDHLSSVRCHNLTTSQSQGAKLGALVGLMGRIPAEERVLVFVQFGDLLAKVAEALEEAGLPCVQLTGTPQRRSAIIEAFQTGVASGARPLAASSKSTSSASSDASKHPRVLLLNLRDESAAGANLTSANHAIFVHPLLVSSQVEFDSCDTQAVGRVRRYGQSRVVQLYRLVVDCSVDEEIFRERRPDADSLLSRATPSHRAAPMQ